MKIVREWVCQAVQKCERKLNPQEEVEIGSSGGRKSGLPNKGDYDEP